MRHVNRRSTVKETFRLQAFCRFHQGADFRSWFKHFEVAICWRGRVVTELTAITFTF
ncbi:hypothetical protein AZ007_002125, partial [Citrobacter freundii]